MNVFILCSVHMGFYVTVEHCIKLEIKTDLRTWEWETHSTNLSCPGCSAVLRWKMLYELLDRNYYDYLLCSFCCFVDVSKTWLLAFQHHRLGCWALQKTAL